MKKILITIGILVIGSCNHNDDVITEKSPFLEIKVRTPSDGGKGVVRRSCDFAKTHSMRCRFSFEHLSKGEYSVRLIRYDLNIAVDNVRQGQNSIVSMYSRKAPDTGQHELAKEYVCRVMNYNCVAY